MDIDTLRAYLLKKPEAKEEFPFGPEAMVFKVMGKMFALVAWAENPLRVSLKCDPDLALSLREVYKAVQPAYHMNKRHWNTVVLDKTVPNNEIFTMIDDSYELVVKGLKKTERAKIQNSRE
ncbi:MAG: MmcQ/YjbR family DNA-binding protein [Deltaproteobacteria bacterium]|nr:MmcQ/YjbR family DNA-binding protein [Deltaproteobacteria bacterium]MBW2050881.1 MmcQ/YjbR family DNA-binding protein [Deltaproteobacteria bacterium]MBW2141723.1 MmcQ/YjbR family DNA-binding protein [Deltaproteobacteria bacterium]MBW2322880.1 MmcQ/YjbR family DNA-binding protein [Deltaproteobacteria bacterium]